MNNFQWIKVYQEICKALLHYKEDQKKLLEILWSCGVDKQFDKKVENGKEIKVDFEEQASAISSSSILLSFEYCI